MSKNKPFFKQGQALKAARAGRKFREIATALGHSNVGRYQNWEYGKNRPGVSEWPRVQAVLGVDCYLLYGDWDPPPAPKKGPGLHTGEPSPLAYDPALEKINKEWSGLTPLQRTKIHNAVMEYAEHNREVRLLSPGPVSAGATQRQSPPAKKRKARR